jgi:hypothetical protein
VLIDPREPNKVLGYYTLCATAHSRYPLVSATLLGRLAVAAGHQG